MRLPVRHRHRVQLGEEGPLAIGPEGHEIREGTAIRRPPWIALHRSIVRELPSLAGGDVGEVEVLDHVLDVPEPVESIGHPIEAIGERRITPNRGTGREGDRATVRRPGQRTPYALRQRGEELRRTAGHRNQLDLLLAVRVRDHRECPPVG